MTFWQLRNGRFSPNLSTTRKSWFNADFGQKFVKSFHSGVICPQNPKRGGGQTSNSLRAGYMHGFFPPCYRSRDALQRDTVFTPHCRQMAREFPRSSTFFVRRTVAEQRGVKLAQFSDFCLIISHTKRLKSTLR